MRSVRLRLENGCSKPSGRKWNVFFLFENRGFENMQLLALVDDLSSPLPTTPIPNHHPSFRQLQ